VSRDNERAVVRVCKGELEGLLSSYPTSEGDDEELLKTATDKLFFAILYRLGRKKVLYFNLQLLVKVGAWLEANAEITAESYKTAVSTMAKSLIEGQ
jgi:hypothetical protein